MPVRAAFARAGSTAADAEDASYARLAHTARRAVAGRSDLGEVAGRSDLGEATDALMARSTWIVATAGVSAPADMPRTPRSWRGVGRGS